MASAIAAAPLVAWSRAQLAQAGAAIDSAVAAWQSAWLPQGADAERADCVAAHERDDARRASWTPIAQNGDARAWLRTGEAAATRLALELFGADTPVAHAVAARAQAALQREIARAAKLDAITAPGDAPAALFDRWSGAVLVTRARLPGLELLLDAACVRRLVDKPQEASVLPAKQPLTDAIANRTLALQVEIAPVELSLGALAGLRIGDVIAFPHAIDDPLQVTAAGARVCDAWLGRRHGQRAVELALAHTEPIPVPSKAA